MLVTRFALVSMAQAEETITGLMFEPAATLKLGWDHIKAVAQVGLQGNFGKIFH